MLNNLIFNILQDFCNFKNKTRIGKIEDELWCLRFSISSWMLKKAHGEILFCKYSVCFHNLQMGKVN